LIGYNSPFLGEKLSQPDYLANPERFPVELGVGVDFRDYLWLYLTANRFDYLVVHRPFVYSHGRAPGLARLTALLADSRVFDDGASIVFERRRMRAPARPVQLTREGWAERGVWQGKRNCLLPEKCQVVLYNPDPKTPLTLWLDLAGIRRPQMVRVRSGAVDVARWDVSPGGFQLMSSPSFHLPVGLHTLTIESTIRPLGSDDPATLRKEQRRPYRLRVAAIHVLPVPDTSAIARRDRERPESPPPTTR
jgi:hypothetical protein